MKKDQSPLDAEMVAVWERGSLGCVTIGPIDYTAALALRHRLYRLRLRMYSLNYPSSEQVAKASVRIHPPKGPGQVYVLIQPTNALIAQALEDAGISSNNPPPLE